MKYKKIIARITSIILLFMLVSPVTVRGEALIQPTVTAGVESLTVTGFTSGATLKLYRTNDGSTPVLTASNVTASEYTFNNVVPNSIQYYVTQTVSGVEGAGSSFINSILGTPTASAGIGYVDAGNIYSGATIELYNANGTLASNSPSDQGGGVYRFTGLTGGNQYYVMQKINGTVSSGTNLVTVLTNVPLAPTVTGELESIKVSGFTSGANLKLYRTDDGSTPVLIASNVTASEYIFSNVVPNSIQYYVTQTVSGVEGAGSSFTNSLLGTPTASAGIGYVDAGNIYSGATIELYNANGTLASNSPSDQGGGVYRFTGLTAGNQYYVMQKINNTVSSGTNLVTVLSNVPLAPTVTGELESIKATGFTSGATLKLYRTDDGSTPVLSASNVTASEYTFSNVVPNSLQYYVTQTVSGVEGAGSSFTNSLLGTPTASAGIGYVDAGNIYSGATIELYNANGTLASNSPSDQGSGVYRFTGLTAGNQYYVMQKINNTVSSGTNLVTVLSNVPLAPTVTGELESIKVTGFTSGATLKLYRTDDGSTPVLTASNVTASEYTFNNVVPNSIQYYVTQTVSGVEGAGSSFTNSLLGTPTASAGIGYVDAGNIYSGATIELYNANGTLASNSPSDQGGGVYRFTGLTAGNQYYVMQKINNTVSSGTNLVTVLSNVPLTPTVTGELESIKVTGFTSGATLKLYRTDDGSTPVLTASNVTASEYTFNNVVPNSIQYYVTQMVSGVESSNSYFVNSLLRTPTASAGIGYVDAGNIYSGATIELYNANGTLASNSPSDQGGGVYRFTGLTAGNQYYVMQKINGTVSSGTSLVTVLTNVPLAPTVTGELESIKVTNFTSGATLKLYRTDDGSTPVLTASNVTASEYIFNNVVPNSIQYYVTQTVSGVESSNSYFVNSLLRTPTASAGIGYVDAGNIYSGAAIELYNVNGTLASKTPTDQGSGVYRFNGLTAGNRYYILQKINSTVSSGTSLVTVLANASSPNAEPEYTVNNPVSTTKSEQITVNVKEGDSDDTVAQIVIERTTEESGRVADKIIYQEEKAVETIKKLQKEGKDTARIVIPDDKSKVSETLVTIPDASVKTLVQGVINLQIDTINAKIDIPKDSLQNTREYPANDLYFKLAPLRSDSDKKDVIDRANMEANVILGTSQGNMAIIGTPVTIETNMPSSPVYITLPLTNISIPEDEQEREKFLQELAVYVEHSDGEKELVRGEIVEFSKGVLGVKFKINKFSIFTLIRTDIFKKSADKDILVVKIPKNASISKSNIKANIDNTISSLTVDVSVSKRATWKLYSDKTCKKIISNSKVTLKTGSNIFYIKVKAEDGSIKIFRMSIMRSKSKVAELVKVISPRNALIKDGIMSATVESKIEMLTIKANVSKKATYQLYLDEKCTKILADYKMILVPGLNTAYLKVTAEDGKTSKIYTVKINQELEYKSHVKLGLIKSKNYAEQVAKIFATEYDASNVTVKKKGNYYRVSMDFISVSIARTVCKDMLRRQYIINYYLY